MFLCKIEFMNIQPSNTPLETTHVPENNNTTRNIIANRNKEVYILFVKLVCAFITFVFISILIAKWLSHSLV